MLRSLVGSEMCIRDSLRIAQKIRMWRAIFDPIRSFLTSDLFSLLPDFIGPRFGLFAYASRQSQLDSFSSRTLPSFFESRFPLEKAGRILLSPGTGGRKRRLDDALVNLMVHYFVVVLTHETV